jgi:hypothetical protein
MSSLKRELWNKRDIKNEFASSMQVGAAEMSIAWTHKTPTILKRSDDVDLLPSATRGQLVPKEDTGDSPRGKLRLPLQLLRGWHEVDKGTEWYKLTIELLPMATRPRCRGVFKQVSYIVQDTKASHCKWPE